MEERKERVVGNFWRETCGIDNGWRNAHLRDTPWTGFTPDRTLVCTLWVDEVVDIFDPKLQAKRRFVRMGDFDISWNSTLRFKGTEANNNIRLALAKQNKLCGFEIKPRERRTVPGAKKVAPQVEYFYMDRYHALQWLPALRPDHERLRIQDEFIKAGMAPPTNTAGNEIGHYFELVPWVGQPPGRDRAPTAENGSASGGKFVHAPEAPAARPPEPVEPVIVVTEPPAWASGWGGGESEHHEALKMFVAAHPQLFGVPADAIAHVEFPVDSGDFIDVVFQSETEWVAIEVKSAISGVTDCRRGVFQVIKYRSVLKAMAAWEDSERPRKVRVLLALQSTLPGELRPLAQRFDCHVVENVQPAATPWLTGTA